MDQTAHYHRSGLVNHGVLLHFDSENVITNPQEALRTRNIENTTSRIMKSTKWNIGN